MIFVYLYRIKGGLDVKYVRYCQGLWMFYNWTEEKQWQRKWERDRDTR